MFAGSMDNEILSLRINDAEEIWSMGKEILHAPSLPKKDTLLPIELTRTEMLGFL